MKKHWHKITVTLTDLSQKKHILFLCSWYPNKNAPTLGNFVQKHAEAVALFNEVSVIGIFSHEKEKTKLVQTVENGVNTFIVYYPKVTFPLFGIKQLIQRFRTKKAFSLAYRNIIKNHGKPDLVHLNVAFPMGQFALFLKRKFHIPFVTTEHSTAYHPKNHQLPKWILQLSTHWMKQSSVLMPVSKDLENSFRQLGIHTRCEVIPNVVNESIFGNLPIIQPKKTRFIHISTAVDAHKNISGILRSIKKLSDITTDFEFQLISDGNIQPFINMAYDELKIDKNILFFEGTKTTNEIARAINESSAFVLFSNYENLPCVILEALTVGKPIISTNVNGIPEAVNKTNGILIEPKDEQPLIDAMLRFIRHEVNFNSESIRKEAIKKYSYHAVGSAFNVIYDEVLNNTIHVTKNH